MAFTGCAANTAVSETSAGYADNMAVTVQGDTSEADDSAAAEQMMRGFGGRGGFGNFNNAGAELGYKLRHRDKCNYGKFRY